MHRASTINLLLSGVVIALGACAAEVGSEGVAVRAPDASPSLTPDGGVAAMRHPASIRERERDALGVAVQCSARPDPLICRGGCEGAQGCCITGVRPLGVCRDLDGCSEQCEWDCGITAARDGTAAALRCEAMCTWRAPEPHCVTR